MVWKPTFDIIVRCVWPSLVHDAPRCARRY